MHPQTNGMGERFNGRIEEVLQSHHFRSGEELETTLRRYVQLYNQQLPQSALSSKTLLQAMKDWHKLKLDLFRKQPYFLTGFDTVFPARHWLVYARPHLYHQRHALSRLLKNLRSKGSRCKMQNEVPIFDHFHPPVEPISHISEHLPAFAVQKTLYQQPVSHLANQERPGGDRKDLRYQA